MSNQDAVTETPVTNEDLIWKAHVLDAQSFKGTHAEYCQLHGLRLRDLQRYKKKFGATRPYQRRRSRAFVKVESAESPVIVRKQIERELSPSLPDPQWLADFIHAMMGRR